MSKLNDWQKKFAVRIKDVMDQVKAFRTKDRMSEAQDYLDKLIDIQLKLDDFYSEVSTVLQMSLGVLNYCILGKSENHRIFRHIFPLEILGLFPENIQILTLDYKKVGN